MSGDRQAQDGVTAAVEGPNVVSSLPNLFFFRRRVIWQRVPVWRTARAPVLVVELNPRLITSWLLILLRKIRGRQTFAWGHVFPRAGEFSRTDKVRGVMRSLLDGMIVYTEGEAASLRRVNPGVKAFVAYNSIYSRSVMKPRFGQDRRDFVMSGRLVPGKKPYLAAAAFAKLFENHPDARLVILGEGTERLRIESDFQRLVSSGAILFRGEVVNPDELFEQYGTAVALVAAGYVGLNATQALGYGVPVIYAGNEPHAPEVEVLNDGNSIEFESGDADSLAVAMETAWRNRSLVDESAHELSGRIASTYSVETMAQAFRDVAA